MISLMTRIYYQARPLLSRWVRLYFRRRLMRRQRARTIDTWPIDPQSADTRPPWKTWPDNKRFSVVLTHDVKCESGLEKCLQLMEIEQQAGVRSSFNFVAEKYVTPPDLRKKLTEQGFEVGVHGLLNDGKLYNSNEIFRERAIRINQTLHDWGALGFRSPSMHHNLEWLHQLNILYDASTFDTDPFEPDHSGVQTIFPFWVPGPEENGGYIELPYTLPQDSSLFLFLQEKTINIWKQKLDWIAKNRGMVLINTHPDYMNFSSKKPRGLMYPADFYRQFLDYLASEYRGLYWLALPREMAEFAKDEYRKIGW